MTTRQDQIPAKIFAEVGGSEGLWGSCNVKQLETLYASETYGEPAAAESWQWRRGTINSARPHTATMRLELFGIEPSIKKVLDAF